MKSFKQADIQTSEIRNLRFPRFTDVWVLKIKKGTLKRAPFSLPNRLIRNLIDR